eukprot:TRINITY_DN113000_c0_g1_i1.p1 TRINITY_DN113000_c0_g1~~TRINITY_DN113000_c0_g1_i1.p1  ORF type:complete len:591 (-),score=71.48 TRINITY_DN113000_c0_g1_i1:126-1859(-)
MRPQQVQQTCHHRSSAVRGPASAIGLDATQRSVRIAGHDSFRNVRECTKAIAEAGRQKHWQDALKFYAAASSTAALSRGLQLDAIVLAAVTCACERATAWQWTLQVVTAEHAAHDGMLPDKISFNAAGGACFKASRWHWPFLLIQQTHRVRVAPGDVLYNTALNCCRSSASTQQQSLALSLELAENMRRSQLEMDTISYGTLVSICESQGDWVRAAHMLDDMDIQGVQTDIIAFNAMLSACEKAGQWSVALFAVEDLLLAMSQGKAAVCADVITFNAAISACEKGRHWEWALWVLSQAPRALVMPDAVTFNAGISACGNCRRWEQVVELVRGIQCSGLQPGVHTCSASVSACEKGHKWEKAAELVRQMQKWEIPVDPVTIGALVAACEKGQQWHRAFVTLRSATLATGKAPNEIVFGAAISAVSQGSSQWPDVLALVEELPQRRLPPNEVILTAAVNGLGSAVQWQRAALLLPAMMSMAAEPNTATCGAVLASFARAREAKQAQALLADFVGPTYKLQPDVSTFCLVAEACEAQFAEARQLLESCERNCLSLVEGWKSSAGEAVTSSLPDAGRLSQS